MIRKTHFTFGLAAVLMLAAGTSARATITGISADGCAGATCQPSFVAPIVSGKQTSVTLKGQYLDLSTSVEISGSGVHVSYGNRSGGSNTFIVVQFNVDSTASLGDRTVKLHYSIETNGPDTFKVTIVRGGHVDKVQQRVAGLLAGTTRLIDADAVPVNQRVTLVFTGTHLGNSAIAPIQAINNPQRLAGCGESKCEFELELNSSGSIDINLYDGDVGQASALALNGLLQKFFYGGAKKITVTGTANPAPATSPALHPVLSGGVSSNPGFMDLAAGPVIANLFRGSGNSITVQGATFLQVENHWCQDFNVPAPPGESPSASKLVTIPDLIWKVSNFGTLANPTAFDSQLLSNGAVLQTQNIAAGALGPGATRDFSFHRNSSSVRLFRFATQIGCFIKPNAGSGEFFVDPQFTVSVNIGGTVAEAQANQANNRRDF